MGLFMSLKLSALPIVDIDNMASSLLALASVSVKPEALKLMQANQEEFRRKYCKDYMSLADIDAYATEAKNDRFGMKSGLSYAWKRVGPYLVLFSLYSPSLQFSLAGLSALIACEYIVRTGSSTWRVCDLIAIENDIKKEVQKENQKNTIISPQSEKISESVSMTPEEMAMSMEPEYHSTIEIIEYFLQKKACYPEETPLETDGIKLVSFGVTISKWEGNKLVLADEQVEKRVSRGDKVIDRAWEDEKAKFIRRAWENVRDMAKVRGLL